MRKVTVFTTASNVKKEINSGASTFGDLKIDLASAGITVDTMKSVVKETRVTLESDAAVLPTGDFALFLFPVKVKSGSDDYTSDSNTTRYSDEKLQKLRKKLDNIFKDLLSDESEVPSSENKELKSEANDIAKELGI